MLDSLQLCTLYENSMFDWFPRFLGRCPSFYSIGFRLGRCQSKQTLDAALVVTFGLILSIYSLGVSMVQQARD